MKRSPGIAIKLLTILMAIGIAGGLGWYTLDQKKEAETLSAQGTKSASFVDSKTADTQEENPIADIKKAKESSESLYTKLSKKEPVRIAVLGDTFGVSSGASEGHEWDAVLKDTLEKNYGSDVTIDNFAVAVTTAFQGYCTVKQNKWDDYDLAIVCFGSMDQNGEIGTFQRDYESIIRGLRRANSQMVIMPMVSTYVSDSNFSGTVRDIASQYGLTCVNMNNAFVDSGKSEDELTTDGVYPNDDGYALYANAIAVAIDQNVQSGVTVSTKKVSAQYDGVKEMDKFKFISADDLTYVSDNQYSYTGDATVLGISYEPAGSGSDSITIEVNGYTYKTIDCVTSYDLDKTHYAIGAVDLSEDDTVTITVNSDSGVKFNGITVSR